MTEGPLPADVSAAHTGGLEPHIAEELKVGEEFGRYRDLRFLGAGGMANVYRAEDPVLGRAVALKLIRGGDPAMAERLLSEARAQARVEHEHVCRIYDAGEVGGRPYIAMQYVQGGTLQSLAGTLRLEQKLRIVMQVAEAVHAAHRLGLIHRDLKPSNVMLERTPEGDYVPYVLDFGLAREIAAPGLTMTGMVLGTAWYMSPEQARGDSRALDRRTDVYALGATLYELVSGKPPYDGQSSVDVLVRILSEEPVPLAQRAPSVPVDVRTIAMRCLERDPGRRYDSARALADDLARYLDGEPIEARPTTTLQRLAKRARKNRTAVAAVALAALAVLVSAGLAVKARLSARAQAALAAEFAQGLSDVDAFLRAAFLAPAHDVRRERAVVRARLSAIERRMDEAGALARGPGEYALGRGQLLLGDAAGARVRLERAWAAGFRPPEAAYALGQALGALYRRELDASFGIGVPAAREARRREIQAQYRDPAVSYLRQGASSGLAPAEYVEGLLALYEKRYPDALAQARASLQRAPWHYEALLLEGDVNAILSRESHETGDAAASRAALDRAESSYRQAADYARSDPAARSGICQLWVQRMEWVLYQGADLAPLYSQARGACETALQVDPDQAEVHARLANVHRFWANSLILHGTDPREALDRAAQSADRAIALDPLSRRGHGNRGVVYRLRASWEMNHGLDPARSLGEALASLGKAAELVPDAGSLNDLGNAYVTRAEATWGTGGDPRGDLKESCARYDQVLQLVPDYGYAHANRGHAFVDQAQYELDHGLDASASLAEAVKGLQRSVELLPQLDGTHTWLAEALLLSAEEALAREQDAAAPLERAQAQLREAAAINPRPGPDTLVLEGTASLVEARALFARGAASRAATAAALAASMGKLRAALAGDARMAEGHRRLGQALLLQARLRAGAGQDAAAAFAAAESALREVVALREKDPRGWAGLAELYQRRAEWTRARGGDAAADLTAGRAAAERALAADPALAQAVAARDALGKN